MFIIDFGATYIISATTTMNSRIKVKPVAKSVEKHKDKEVARRSERSCKGKFHDSYFVGHEEIDKYIGIDSDEEEVGLRRFRKKYFRDDGSDYEDNHRYGRKRYRSNGNTKKQETRNPIQGLLKWRYDLSPVPQPTKDNSKIIKVKSICKQQLDKHAQNVEAIFINIDWNEKGQTIEDFRNLRINSNKLMEKGLVFIWTPANLMMNIVDIMLGKQFFYVENLEIGLMDRSKAIKYYKTKYGINEPKVTQSKQKPKSTKRSKLSKEKSSTQQDKQLTEDLEIDLQLFVPSLQDCNPADFMATIDSPYFNKSKKTLFFFRKNSDGKLQLRHQRTCDAVFDMPKDPRNKCQPELKAYIYNMIETLLPKCISNTQELKMLELWGDPRIARRGWITMVEN